MSGTNGHTDHGAAIDGSIEADLKFANSSRKHELVAERKRAEDSANEAAAEGRKTADERWAELADIRQHVADGKEATAQEAAQGPPKPLAKVLKFFEGKGMTTAENLDTVQRVAQITEDEAAKLVLVATDKTEARKQAERELALDTMKRFRAVCTRRSEAMKQLYAGCGGDGDGGLPPLLLSDAPNYPSWAKVNVFVGADKRPAILAELYSVFTEDANQ